MTERKARWPTFRVVLVEPEYGMNVGMAARVMKNFGFQDLRIVNPKCEIGFDAVKYSKHAVGLLKKARRHLTLAGAVKGCGLVVGTTGVLRRNKGTIRSAVGLGDFCASLGEYRGQEIALVFGREGIGLNAQEIGECDLLVHVEADQRYPILNISHAMAVVLYAVRQSHARTRGLVEERINVEERRALMQIFNKMAGRYRLRNPEKCRVAFARVVARANPTRAEGQCLLNVFRLVLEEIDDKDDTKNHAQ